MIFQKHNSYSNRFSSLLTIEFAHAFAFAFAFVMFFNAPDASARSALPADVKAEISGAQLSGTGKLTFFGLNVYEANLWVTSDFKPTDFQNHAFALDLQYLRNFAGDAIAKRSIEEMQRIEPIPEQQAQKWLATLKSVIPDIRKGDRLIGTHQPNVGMVFWHNGKRSGEIKDAAFSRQFFAIWLSLKTSEPKLRVALLGKTDTTQ
jgi:Chalcone isomerase-like